jgi:hypothetical protein
VSVTTPDASGGTLRGESSSHTAPPGLAWLAAIRDPQIALGWSLPEWERVVRIARRGRLLARLAESLDAAGLLAEVPEPPRRHLIAEQRVSRQRIAAMVWALERTRIAIGGASSACVLLKGAAYIGQEIPIAAGRLPSDVDILVPKRDLAAVQARLATDHWTHYEIDEHDERYYREWSHEVPPLVHPLHPIELDLHHGILPPTARTTVDTAALLPGLRESKWPGWKVLDPVDQVLHCAAHLFLDSELRERLRDLVDLDGLFRYFGEREPGFWARLVPRARELGLGEPLALAVDFCVRWLGTPVPVEITASLADLAPSRARRAWLVPALSSLLMPVEPDADPPVTRGVAAWVVLARYHRWRMPLSLLVPHLARKAWKRVGAEPSPSPQPSPAERERE